LKPGSQYFKISPVDTVRKWQECWFYCADERTPSAQEGLPAYTEEPPLWKRCWGAKPSRREMPDVERLLERVKELQAQGLTGVDLIVTWLDRRIQPLQAREHPMWEYSGVSDSTRGNAEELSNEVFMERLKSLTKERSNLSRVPHVAPYSAGNPPPNVSIVVFRVQSFAVLMCSSF
jgi:hypothetical protein